MGKLKRLRLTAADRIESFREIVAAAVLSGSSTVEIPTRHARIIADMLDVKHIRKPKGGQRKSYSQHIADEETIAGARARAHELVAEAKAKGIRLKRGDAKMLAAQEWSKKSKLSWQAILDGMNRKSPYGLSRD